MAAKICEARTEGNLGFLSSQKRNMRAKMESEMQEELWQGIEFKLAEAEFFFDRMGKSREFSG